VLSEEYAEGDGEAIPLAAEDAVEDLRIRLGACEDDADPTSVCSLARKIDDEK
jgi:hypothetical protein